MNQIVEGSLPVVSLHPTMTEEVPVSNIFKVAWRHKLLILTIFGVIVGSVAAIIYQVQPYYRSTAVLLIDSQGSHPLSQLTIGESPQTDMVGVKTQVSIIRSPHLAERVVAQLDLTHSPEYREALDTPPSALRQWLTSFKSWAADEGPRFVTDWIESIQTLLGGDAPREPLLTPEARAKTAADMLLGKMSVANDGKSYLIEITAQATDAVLSARIANEFAKTYLDFNRKLKIDAITEANTRFFDQLPPLAEKVRDADRAVQTFRVAHGLTPASGHGSVDGRGATLADQQLAQVDVQYGEAVNDRTEKEARLKQITDAMAGKGKIDSVPDIVGSSLIQQLRQKQSELRSQEAGLRTSLLGADPHLIAVRASEANLTATINTEIGKIAASVGSLVQAARNRETALHDRLNELRDVVASQSEAEIKLRDLENQADAAREVYTSYLHRFQQTASLGLMQQPDAELISLADVPLHPAGPRRMQFLGLAAALGGVLAVLCALLTERWHSGFVSAQDLEGATGLSVIGFVPRLRRGLVERSSRRTQFLYREAVNNVRSTLEFGDAKYRARVVLVTSALPQEGKTHFATSLARSVADSGGRALLVECDLRRPAVVKSLKLTQQGNWLVPTSNAGISDGSLSSSYGIAPGLDFAMLQGSEHSAVPSLARARRAFDVARSEYDLIVLDAPPVLACADADLLCGVADGVIMVVRWGSTTKGSVATALRTLRMYGTRTVGAVLNAVDIKQLMKSDSDQAELYRRYAKYNG